MHASGATPAYESGRAVFSAIDRIRDDAGAFVGSLERRGLSRRHGGQRACARPRSSSGRTSARAAIYVNVPGAFDTHANQLAANSAEYPPLAAALVAFRRDIGRASTTSCSWSRRSSGARRRRTASAGTDHGFAHCGLFLGGSVRGGRVHGTWPGLSAGPSTRGATCATRSTSATSSSPRRAGSASRTRAGDPGLRGGGGSGAVRVRQIRVVALLAAVAGRGCGRARRRPRSRSGMRAFRRTATSRMAAPSPWLLRGAPAPSVSSSKCRRSPEERREARGCASWPCSPARPSRRGGPTALPFRLAEGGGGERAALGLGLRGVDRRGRRVRRRMPVPDGPGRRGRGRDRPSRRRPLGGAAEVDYRVIGA